MKKKSYIYLLISTLCISLISLCGCSRTAGPVICLENYITSGTDDDIMPAIRKAIDDCRKNSASKLVLPEGVYNIKGDFAFERYCFVSNNDEGLKRIAFDLSDIKNLEIQGNDTKLEFTGYVVPFLLDHSENITVSGISIDYTTPFHSEAEIKSVNREYADVHFNEDEFPYEIKNGFLYFDNKPTGTKSFDNLLEFDKEKREPACHACDNWIDGTIRAEKLNNGDVRIFRSGLKGKIGNIFVFGSGHRKVPGFIISDSKGILIKDVAVYHAGGMAFIAQRSADIELNHVSVTPPADRRRIISATADATHFSNCAGYIRLIDCLFENQLDDATNIHGIYCRIEKIIDPKTLLLKLVHHQQYGFFYFKKGTKLEIVNNENLISVDEAVVKDVRILNKEYVEVGLDKPVSAEVKEGFSVARTDCCPDVLIKGCTIRSNRARGLLIGSRGKVEIDSNYFHVAGSSIYFEGDASYWFEQSGVRDVEITRNLFDNCQYGCPGWGKASICVGSGIYRNRDESRYHHNIKVHDNLFRNFDPRIVNLYCVDGFDFYDNTFEEGKDYVYGLRETRNYVYDDCDNVNIR